MLTDVCVCVRAWTESPDLQDSRACTVRREMKVSEGLKDPEDRRVYR